MKVEKYKSIYYKQVNKIYEKSFPTYERYITLEEMIASKDTELYCLIDNDSVVGIIYLIFYKDMIFILYLAIENNNRSKGYGSYLLKWCMNEYANKTIFVNIEEVNEKFDDYEIRKKRLNFYLKNGFFLTDYMNIEEAENFNILSNKLEMNVEQYKKLDEVVANVLNEPIDNIVKIN